MALFTIRELSRDVDSMNIADLTDAVRTGPAAWIDETTLEIPLDRELTEAEHDAILLRLKSRSDAEDQLRRQAIAYLNLASPTNAQNVAAIKGLIRLVGGLLDVSRK